MIINKFCRTINAQVSNIKERMECTKSKHESTQKFKFEVDANQKYRRINKETDKLSSNRSSMSKDLKACEVTVGPENIIKYFMEYFPPSSSEITSNEFERKQESLKDEQYCYRQREESQTREEMQERYDWNRLFLVRHEQMPLEQMQKFVNFNKKCLFKADTKLNCKKNYNKHQLSNKEQFLEIKWQELFANAHVTDDLRKENGKNVLCAGCRPKKIRYYSIKRNKSTNCKSLIHEEQHHNKREFWWSTPATFELYYCNQQPESHLEYCEKEHIEQCEKRKSKIKEMLLSPHSFDSLSFTHVGTLFAIPALPQPAANVCCTWETFTYMYTNLIQCNNNVAVGAANNADDIKKRYTKLKKRSKPSIFTSHVPSLQLYEKWMRSLNEEFHNSSGKCLVGTVISLAEYISFVTGVNYQSIDKKILSLTTNTPDEKTRTNSTNYGNEELEQVNVKDLNDNCGKCLFDFPQHHTYNSTKRNNLVKRKDGSLHQNWNCISLHSYLQSVFYSQNSQVYRLLSNQLTEALAAQELHHTNYNNNCRSSDSTHQIDNNSGENIKYSNEEPENNSDVLVKLIVQNNSFTVLRKWLQRHSIGVLLLLNTKWIYFVLLMHVYNNCDSKVHFSGIDTSSSTTTRTEKYNILSNNKHYNMEEQENKKYVKKSDEVKCEVESESLASSYQTSCGYSFVVKPIDIAIEDVEMLFSENSTNKSNVNASVVANNNNSVYMYKGQVNKSKRYKQQNRHKTHTKKENVNQLHELEEKEISNSLFVPSTVLVYASRDMQLSSYNLINKNTNYTTSEYPQEQQELTQCEFVDEECSNDMETCIFRQKQHDKHKSIRNYISTHRSSCTQKHDYNNNDDAFYNCNLNVEQQNECNQEFGICEYVVSDWSRIHKQKTKAKHKAEIQLLFTHYMNCYLQKMHTMIVNKTNEDECSKNSSSKDHKTRNGKLKNKANKATTRNKIKMQTVQKREENFFTSQTQELLSCTALCDDDSNRTNYYSVFPSPTHLLTNYKWKEHPEFLAYEMRYGKLIKFRKQ